MEAFIAMEGAAAAAVPALNNLAHSSAPLGDVYPDSKEAAEQLMEEAMDDSASDLFGPESWNPQSWNGKPEAQAVQYSNAEVLQRTVDTLHTLPPLVDPSIIEDARKCLADVAHGKAFIVQGGDCAEDFSDIQFDLIADKVKLLSSQAEVLGHGLDLPIVRIGRIAGQYAKPRSNPFETLPDGSKIHAFRGCNVNGNDLESRSPDPTKLLAGYFHAAATLNTISQIDEAHKKKAHFGQPKASQLFTSHEALSLPFEAALTRGKYDTSATMIWIGERTRQLDGAHVELLRGLRNPVGVKIGPTANPADLVTLLNALSRDGIEPGKLTLITRMGAGKAEKVLPALIQAVNESGHKPVWLCDPCHGNTVSTPKGKKTRNVETILDEVKQTYKAHRDNHSHLGGLHLEQTGEDVTECVDTAISEESDRHLEPNYRSLCDPRLSRDQALHICKEFVKYVRQIR